MLMSMTLMSKLQILFDSTECFYTVIDSTNNYNNGELTESLLPEFLNTLNPPNSPLTYCV